MSIKRIPGKGLLIEMGDYIRLRASMGGSDFWYPDYQKILLEKFKPFLPRMEYNPTDNTVTASIVENGEELLSSSTSDKIPEKELKKFKALLKQIQEEVEQEGTDPDIKRVIKAFRLPDPGKAPELYRVYGKRRLAIIWGLEKQVESSIPVIGGEIVKTLTTISDKKGGAFKWLCCGAIVAAIAALVWWASPFDETEPPTQEGAVITVPVDSAIDNLAKQVIYKVLISKNGQPVGTATAFAASADGILVTNAHVAKEFGSEGVKYQVESTSGKRYPVEKVTHSNVEDDVALLKIPANSIPYLKLRTEQKPRRGEYVYIPGYPLGASSYFLATGKVTSVDDKGNGHAFFHDAAVSPGSSGSPVVDTHGQAVGVVIGNISDKEKQAQRLNFAVWVGVLKNAPIQQPSTGHLVLPENVETKEIPTTTESTDQSDPDEPTGKGPAGGPTTSSTGGPTTTEPADPSDPDELTGKGPAGGPTTSSTGDPTTTESTDQSDPDEPTGKGPAGGPTTSSTGGPTTTEPADPSDPDELTGKGPAGGPTTTEPTGQSDSDEPRGKGLTGDPTTSSTGGTTEPVSTTLGVPDRSNPVGTPMKGRTVSVELPDDIRIEARVLTEKQDAQGRFRVRVHVEAPDFKGGTIKGKEIDSNRNVEILIDQNGEEIPYEIYRWNSKYPTTGGCRINVN